MGRGQGRIAKQRGKITEMKKHLDNYTFYYFQSSLAESDIS